MSSESKLEQIRARINELDSQLIKLISERAALAQEVAEVKQAAGDNSSFYRPDREAQILNRVIELNAGPLSDEELSRLFREIMSACLALEEPLQIAYLGPEGTFTQTAVQKHFGHSVSVYAQNSIDQVFREVESAACQYGVVPIENSTEGMISATHDLLINTKLRICGEVQLPIRQYLMSQTDDLKIITKIYSHQQSLAQCRLWLDDHLPTIERIAVNSNAEAARFASEEVTSAAIAGEAAAETYGLKTLAKNIEDEPNNTTRFLVLGKENIRQSGKDKTSLIFTTPNKSGALHKVLACFSDNSVSMTRIESRPSRQGMWDYVFFVDVEGHCEDKPVAAALKSVEQHASKVKLLGSYPKGGL